MQLPLRGLFSRLLIFYGSWYFHPSVTPRCYKCCKFLLSTLWLSGWTWLNMAWSEKEARIRLSSDSNFPINREEESQTHTPIPKDPISESKVALDPRSTMLSAPETFKSDDAARPALFQPSPIVYEGSRTSFDRPGSVLMNDRQSTTSRLTVPASIATHESSNAASSNYSYSQKALALYNCK